MMFIRRMPVHTCCFIKFRRLTKIVTTNSTYPNFQTFSNVASDASNIELSSMNNAALCDTCPSLFDQDLSARLKLIEEHASTRMRKNRRQSSLRWIPRNLLGRKAVDCRMCHNEPFDLRTTIDRSQDRHHGYAKERERCKPMHHA